MLEAIIIGACIGIWLGWIVNFFWGDQVYDFLDRLFNKLGIS